MHCEGDSCSTLVAPHPQQATRHVGCGHLPHVGRQPTGGIHQQHHACAWQCSINLSMVHVNKAAPHAPCAPFIPAGLQSLIYSGRGSFSIFKLKRAFTLGGSSNTANAPALQPMLPRSSSHFCCRCATSCCFWFFTLASSQV